MQNFTEACLKMISCLVCLLKHDESLRQLLHSNVFRYQKWKSVICLNENIPVEPWKVPVHVMQCSCVWKILNNQLFPQQKENHYIACLIFLVLLAHFSLCPIIICLFTISVPVNQPIEDPFWALLGKRCGVFEVGHWTCQLGGVLRKLG